MPFPRVKPLPRFRRWLFPAALFALAPKCLVCVLGYLGVGAALGLVGPEFCGAPERSALPLVVAWAWFASVAGLAVWWARRRKAQSCNK